MIQARYAKEKLTQLQALNTQLDILRHQTRLLLDFHLLSDRRYEYVSQHINTIGTELEESRSAPVMHQHPKIKLGQVAW